MKADNVFYVRNIVDVVTIADDDKSAGRDLPQQIVNTPALLFIEQDRRPNNKKGAFIRLFVIPVTTHLLRPIFGAAILIEWSNSTALVSSDRRNTVHRYRANQYDFSAVVFLCHNVDIGRSLDIDVDVEVAQTNVVAMFCRQIYNNRAFRKNMSEPV